ncbi:hypothetical protein Tco_1322441 [Tanacetum coccineum]
MGTIRFKNDHIAEIMGYRDYQMGNVTISQVYYVEGLGHNLISVGQFCDSDLEVAFRKHTCFICDLEGVDLIKGLIRSGYQQKGRKPSQNDKTEHGMEITVQNQGQSPKMTKSESILKNQQSNRAGPCYLSPKWPKTK